MMTLDTYIVSDTHFRHKNIIRYCNRPADHDSIMANNWNKIVGHNDTILHLGDVATWYGSTSEAADILANLNGKKFLILGNHDTLGQKWYKDLGFEVVAPFTTTLVSGQRVRFSHHPETDDLDWDINVHGHIHNNGYPPNADPQRDYRNVSVEVVDYEPVLLREILYANRYASHKQLGFNVEQLRKLRR